MRSISFQARLLAGYAVIILFLAGGMAIAIRQLAELTAAQVGHIQHTELEITEAERLRWSGELIVSAGRGYLIAAAPELRRRVRQAEAEFDDGVQALADADLTPGGRSLVAEVERSAVAFRRAQKRVLAERNDAGDLAELTRRFEAELLPLHDRFALSLDRLVEHKTALVRELYADAQRRAENLTFLMHGTLGLLVLASLAAACYFARQLGRSYRHEHEANQLTRTALAARDQIMGMVAHDLRNPLNAITMKAGLLQEATAPEKVRQQAQSIVNVAMRMEFLIRTMLDVTTIEAGKLSVTLARCAVETLLHDTQEMFAPLAASKHIGLNSESREPNLVVQADRERLLQVLSNLLGNALKFTPDDGRVTLTAQRVGELVRFAVIDSGPGIPREHVANVFDRFWKKEAPGKKGTGLGLFIAKGIIEAHGGRIWVETERDQGAGFCFTIPLADGLLREEPRPSRGIESVGAGPT